MMFTEKDCMFDLRTGDSFYVIFSTTDLVRISFMFNFHLPDEHLLCWGLPPLSLMKPSGDLMVPIYAWKLEEIHRCGMWDILHEPFGLSQRSGVLKGDEVYKVSYTTPRG